MDRNGIVKVPFVKMHGIGNDYIYVDALNGEKPEFLKEESLGELSRAISDRHFGIGSDGLILILPSDKADFRMRIFNSDGSEAKMCGNGIRCVAKYLYDLGFTTKKEITVETESGVKHLRLNIGNEEVKSVLVNMGAPSFKRKDFRASGNGESEMSDEIMKVGDMEFAVTGVSMGNPHGVVYVDNIDNLKLEEIGPVLENNEIWHDRANIEFVKILSENEIRIRVWERGSGETLACGTGACAASVVSFKKGLIHPKVKVHLKGGKLDISYNEKENIVIMEGAAEFIAKGTYYWHKNQSPDNK